MIRLCLLITLSFLTFNAFAKVECPTHTKFIAADELCQLNVKLNINPGNRASIGLTNFRISVFLVHWERIMCSASMSNMRKRTTN